MEAHMIEQIIKYSDGTQKSIKYRGKYVDGVLVLNEDEKMDDEKEPTTEEVEEKEPETLADVPEEEIE